MLEAWLTEKLVEPTISDSIPVLEDNIQSSVESIEQHLRQDPKVWSGISKSFIHIRCGHVFMLDTCCDDETIVHLGADEFYQDVIHYTLVSFHRCRQVFFSHRYTNPPR